METPDAAGAGRGDSAPIGAYWLIALATLSWLLAILFGVLFPMGAGFVVSLRERGTAMPMAGRRSRPMSEISQSGR